MDIGETEYISTNLIIIITGIIIKFIGIKTNKINSFITDICNVICKATVNFIINLRFNSTFTILYNSYSL